jgi:hypothetical protein
MITSRVRNRRLETIAAASLIGLSGCSTFDLLTDNCATDFVRVTWPATITRGTSTTNVTLFGSVTAANIDPSQFELLGDVITGRRQGTLATIVWTVPAFDINGGYIAFTHSAPLTVGDSVDVDFAFDGGGWGAASAAREIPAAIAVRGDNFNATEATGTLTVLSTSPLRLHVDVTTRNAANQSMSISGDAQFRYETVRSSCS